MPLSENREYRYPSARSGPDLAAHLAALAEDVDLDVQAVAESAAEATKTAQDVQAALGQVSVPWQVEDTAWRQTTEEGDYLPLGYTAAGGLDAFARKVWKKDILEAEEIPAHPDYARVLLTENMDILAALTWDGKIILPGLPVSAAPGPSTPEPSTERPLYADPLAWSMWGSSSAAGIAAEMTAAAAAHGATFLDGGKGGEWSFQIAARLGSVPARLTFPGNTVPASGAVAVGAGVLDVNGSSLKTFTGYVETTSGARVSGSLGYSSGGLYFVRATPGTAEPILPGAAFIPDLGTAARGGTVLLWMGKGNAGEVERVLYETRASYDYLAPQVKRCLVLGHFVNTGRTAGDTGRAKIQAINSAYAASYGPAYVDVSAYLTGSQVWADTGITPTAQDLAEQKLGNKPPSLSSDDQHLNDAADRALAALIIRHMETLAWLPAAQA